MNEEILLMFSSLEERVEALTEDEKETKEIPMIAGNIMYEIK